MSSKAASTKSSATSVKIKVEPDIYDQWRPPEGVKYQLSQTQVDFNANVPNLTLKYTTVEYEPGQDLTIKEDLTPSVKYARPRGRGPVFRFQEEIEAERIKKIQAGLIKNIIAKCLRQEKAKKLAVKSIHDELILLIGPKWFHELSVKQMESADALKDAMIKDYKLKTIINTQETLGAMGIVYYPNHTKVEYALKKYYLCPVEFLLTLFRLNRPKDPKAPEYTLNDRIMLSAVVHLSLREIFRELHLRIPSPPRTDDEPKKKVKRKKKQAKKKEIPTKFPKGTSPYLIPMIPVEQHHTSEEYKNRHKEYASLEYFDYVTDMWSVTIEDDLDSVKKRENTTSLRESKWTKPPKIPVRLIESKMKKKKVCKLKKPSPYISPCKEAKMHITPIKEEPLNVTAEGTTTVITTNVELDNVCCCSPATFNEDTTFNLKIKITTSEDEMWLTKKLCPYSTKNVTGELQLQSQHKIKKTTGPCTGTNEDKVIKKIEYSCECCVCGKTINLFPEKSSVKSSSIQQIAEESINTMRDSTLKVVSYADLPEEDEDMEEYEYQEENYCQCVTPPSTESDINDPYYLCTCKSSDDCTCCLCNDMDKDFVLKINRYNEVFGTSHRPCQCFCKCKKKKKKPPPEENICKYCFCPKRKPIIEDEEMEEEEEEIEEETKITSNTRTVTMVAEEQEKKPSVKTSESAKKISASKSKSLNANQSILQVSPEDADEEEPEICACKTLYAQYMDAHESCMSLFQHYKEKIKEDVEEYVRDLKNTHCYCMDSASTTINEMDEEFLNYEHEEIEDFDTCCNKSSLKPGTLCCCCSTDYNSDFKGCTCNDAGVDITGCICNEPSSTSSSDDSTVDSLACTCGCTCGQGPCQCKEFVEKVREIRAANKEAQAEEDTMMKQTLKEENKDEAFASVTETNTEQPVEEIDPRIFILDKFPKSKSKQMALLKTALAALAEDGYPMAKLPEVEKLPHFQIWMNFRTQAYISMEERDNYLKGSRKYWAHCEVCKHKNDLPEWPIPKHIALHVTWDRVNLYQRLIRNACEDFSRRSKQTFIAQGQEFFPSVEHYLFPTKTFRDCYFSYLPSDENHCFVYKPWESHEHKDPSNHKPCT